MEAYQLAFLADPKIHTAALRRALPVVRSRADAEDAVQDAALRALRYRNTLRPGVAATSWFMRIVSRAAFDIVTSRKRFWVVDREGASFVPGSETAALARERSHEIREAIDALPAAQRQAVILHDLEGFTTGAIAVRAGVPASTVRTRLRRARIALRGALTVAVAA